MQIPFQIVALPMETFSSLFNQSNEQLRAIGAYRTLVDKKPGYPCRVSLIDAELGEEVILTSFTHHDVTSPYRASGPIFVRKKALTAQPHINEIPAMLQSRLLSIRAYNMAAMMIGAEVINGSELEEHIWKIFSNKNVEYIHIHNASPGCYNCRVQRV